jgi:DNA-binding response OmpR family regulator
MKIICLSEDQALSDRIFTVLSSHHFVVDTVQTPEMLNHCLSLFPYTLIIIDTKISTLDVFSFAKELQLVQHPLMLLLIFEELSYEVEVLSLNAGADDCLRESCGDDELLAHVCALLRRKGEKSPVIGRWGDLVVDCKNNQASYAGKKIPLTPKEYQIMLVFLSSPRQTFSAQSLIDCAWPSIQDQPSVETIKTHIRSLRVKLKQVGIEDLVETVYGFGYRLNFELLTAIATGKELPSSAAKLVESN